MHLRIARIFIMTLLADLFLTTACGVSSKSSPEAIIYHGHKVVAIITLEEALREMHDLKLKRKAPNNFVTLESAVMARQVSLAAGDLSPDPSLLRSWERRLRSNRPFARELAIDATYMNNAEERILIPSKISEKAFYNANISLFKGQTFGRVQGQIEHFLIEQQRKTVEAKYIAKAKEEFPVKYVGITMPKSAG